MVRVNGVVEIAHIMNSEIKKKRISKKKFGKIKNVNYICGVNFFHFVWIRMLFGTTSREVRSPFFLEKCENHTIFALEKCEIMETDLGKLYHLKLNYFLFSF